MMRVLPANIRRDRRGVSFRVVVGVAFAPGAALWWVELLTRRLSPASLGVPVRTSDVAAPGIAAFGAAKYCGLIFERESGGETTAP